MHDISLAESVPSTKLPGSINKPAVGQWYWVATKEGPYFMCAVHVGTNYVELESPQESTIRVHFKDFSTDCKHEPEPNKHIESKVTHHKKELDRLICAVKELTLHLGLSAQPALPGEAVQALSVRGSNDAIDGYKNALVLAKDETLPKLFEDIKKQSASLSVWMSASLIPLKAQAEGLESLIGSVESRIFNVELYAGLIETVELIADGTPAPISEPLHLFQRRAYMDEECLANYSTGGMEYESIGEFDAWIAKPENRDCILPFPRCLIAFQVRRNTKEREGINLGDFIEIHFKEMEDKKTFLYMRNGDKLFRLSTAIQFEPKLFPDNDTVLSDTGLIYARMFCEKVDELISERQYKERSKDHFYKWEPFTPDNVYFDEIEAHLKKQRDDHNRLVIVLQGLLDRSLVFHPHMACSLWKEDDFRSMVRLIYDDSRALTSGDPPDFEAYRQTLNKSLKKGSITVGQEDAWEIKEAAKETARLDGDWRTKTHYRPTRFRPYGNPGPGKLATVAELTKSGVCTYHWERERLTSRWGEPRTVPCTLRIPSKEVLNVSAYVPGDFKQFFNDPRTRADYLKWAPMLLRAEEYHAEKRKGK